MRTLHVRRLAGGVLALGVSVGAFALAQGITGGFEGYWGSKYSRLVTDGEDAAAEAAPATARTGALAIAEAERLSRPTPTEPRSRLVRWNQIAIDASGVDHTPLDEGETRTFGEQLGPGRASRAMAIVHIAIADAVNA